MPASQSQISDTVNGIVIPRSSGPIIVHVNTPLETSLKILANGLEIAGLLGGLLLFIQAFSTPSESAGVRRLKVAMALASILIGLVAPDGINWLIGRIRDAYLFS